MCSDYKGMMGEGGSYKGIMDPMTILEEYRHKNDCLCYTG